MGGKKRKGRSFCFPPVTSTYITARWQLACHDGLCIRPCPACNTLAGTKWKQVWESYSTYCHHLFVCLFVFQTVHTFTSRSRKAWRLNVTLVCTWKPRHGRMKSVMFADESSVLTVFYYISFIERLERSAVHRTGPLSRSFHLFVIRWRHRHTASADFGFGPACVRFITRILI